MILLLVAAESAHAQQQDRKLMDRLLKPDTTLVSPEQNKQFAFRGTTMTKTAPTKSFYVPGRSDEKRFTATSEIAPSSYRTNASPDANRPAILPSRSAAPTSENRYPVRDYTNAHSLADAEKTVDTSAYSGTRAFLVRGKSQKALSAHDKPLTIDEVRELLNKNK
jgi:hypothetical protein